MPISSLKTATILLLSFLLMATASIGQQNSAGNIKYYTIKSGKITYRFSNGLQDGEKTLIFDDWGNYEKLTLLIHTNNIGSTDTSLTKMAGTAVRILYLKTPGAIYSVNLDDRTGIKIPHIPLDIKSGFLGDSSRLVKIGMDTLLGRLCDVYIADNVQKLWLWKGLALKKQLLDKVDGFSVSEFATAIDEAYYICTDEFILRGIEIQTPPSH